MSSSSQNLYQTPPSAQTSTVAQNQQGLILSTFQSQTKVSYVSQSGGVVYAQPAQVMGGSPNAVRRITSFRSQSADRKSEGKLSCHIFYWILVYMRQIFFESTKPI